MASQLRLQVLAPIAVIAILVGIVVRLRGKGEVPPTAGGWRRLEGPDFR